MLIRITLVLLVTLPVTAFAEPTCAAEKSGANWLRYYTEACDTLRVAATDCSLCHHPNLDYNAYGLDLVPVGNLPWLIEDLDSDRDGRTNLQEIQDCTLPGDRDSVLPLVDATWSLLKRVWR